MVKHLWLFSLLTLALLPAVFTSQVAEEDSLKIMRGFCDGLDLDADITSDAFIEGDDIADVITLLSAENNRFATKGLKKLGSTLTRVPDIIDNKAGNPGADSLYLTKIQELATHLEDIDAYEPGDTNNLTIKGVSIVELVNNATNSLNGGNYYQAGLSMGMALANVFTATQPPVSEEVVAEVQQKAEEQGWVAGEVPAEFQQFQNIDEFRKHMLGIPEEVQLQAANAARRRRRIRAKTGMKKTPKVRRQSLPASFDARQKWPNCVLPIRNQGQCGSCWAFAGANAFADRFCIASGSKIRKVFSPQHMLECEKQSSACDGGVPYYEFEYIKRNGIFQESCFPYIAGPAEELKGFCPSTCVDGSKPNVFYSSDVIDLNDDNEDEIKEQLYNYGPLTTAFTVYQDFMQYKGGVYSHVSGGKSGGHGVKLIGWGVDAKTGKQYWLCANSWGADWGENGYFKIRFGDSDINMMVNGGTPDLKRSITGNNNGDDIPGEDNSGNTGGAEFNKDTNTNDEGQPDNGGDVVPDSGDNQDNQDNGNQDGDVVPDNADNGGQDGSWSWDDNSWSDWGDWGNTDDWSDKWNDWSNTDDWSDTWNDWTSDWDNTNDWSDDWNSWSNDAWNSWNSNDDNGNTNNKDWTDWNNWGWRNGKSSVIARGIRASVRQHSPRTTSKNPTTHNRGPVRRRRRVSPQNQRRIRRRSESNKVKPMRRASVRKASPMRSTQKQAHHLSNIRRP